MFNDFSGFDAESNPVKISVPPTLLISSIGIHPDVAKAVSMDAKFEGDFIYVIGETSEELGGSEYFASLGSTGNTVPALDAKKAKARYQRLIGAIDGELVASAHPVSHGGLVVALAKVAIAGRIGMDITIPSGMRPDYYLFSESLGRFVITVSPANQKAFEKNAGNDAVLLGTVGSRSFRVAAQKTRIDIPVDELENAYKSPFRGY
jgi:phosphoribosylformylglycinamidine synthase